MDRSPSLACELVAIGVVSWGMEDRYADAPIRVNWKSFGRDDVEDIRVQEKDGRMDEISLPFGCHMSDVNLTEGGLLG